jgi:hypothetical protein
MKVVIVAIMLVLVISSCTGAPRKIIKYENYSFSTGKGVSEKAYQIDADRQIPNPNDHHSIPSRCGFCCLKTGCKECDCPK